MHLVYVSTFCRIRVEMRWKSGTSVAIPISRMPAVTIMGIRIVPEPILSRGHNSYLIPQVVRVYLNESLKKVQFYYTLCGLLMLLSIMQDSIPHTTESPCYSMVPVRMFLFMHPMPAMHQYQQPAALIHSPLSGRKNAMNRTSRIIICPYQHHNLQTSHHFYLPLQSITIRGNQTALAIHDTCRYH